MSARLKVNFEANEAQRDSPYDMSSILAGSGTVPGRSPPQYYYSACGRSSTLARWRFVEGASRAPLPGQLLPHS